MMKKLIVGLILLCSVAGFAFLYILSNNSGSTPVIEIQNEVIDLGCSLDQTSHDELLDGVKAYVIENGEKINLTDELVIENETLLSKTKSSLITYVVNYKGNIVKKSRHILYSTDELAIVQEKDISLSSKDQLLILSDYVSVEGSCGNEEKNLAYEELEPIDYSIPGEYPIHIYHKLEPSVTLDTVVIVVDPNTVVEEPVVTTTTPTTTTKPAVTTPPISSNPNFQIIFRQSSVELKTGDYFNYMSYIQTITDEVDSFNDLARRIQLFNRPNMNQPGTYDVGYRVNNSRGQTAVNYLKVIVTGNPITTKVTTTTKPVTTTPVQTTTPQNTDTPDTTDVTTPEETTAPVVSEVPEETTVPVTTAPVETTTPETTVSEENQEPQE